MGFSKERLTEIWDDTDGSKIEVGPDRDTLGLVEVRSYDSNGKIDARLLLELDQARLLAEALIQTADEQEAR